MLTDAELTAMRETSASALPDTGTITRPAAGGGSLDPVTGIYTPAASTTIYSGSMRVRPPTATELDVLFGDEQVTKQRYVATLPHTATGILIDDRLTVLSGSDDEIESTEFRVTSPSVGSWQIDRRIGLEVVQ